MAHRFGFIVHPLTGFQRRVFGVRSMDIKLALGLASPDGKPSHIAKLRLDLPRMPIKGALVSLPSLPQELLTDQRQGIEHVLEGIRLCEEQNSSVIGLGGVAAMIGGQGKVASRSTQTPVTSGNHLTAETAFQTTLLALSHFHKEQAKVSVLGLPSPVGLLLVQMLAYQGVDVEMVIERPPSPLRKLAEALGRDTNAKLEFVSDVQCTSSRILVAASSTGAGIKISTIPTKMLVIDVAAPADIIMDKMRDDVVVVDGEYLSVPAAMRGDIWQSIYRLLTRQPDALLACFAEPMLIAASERFELCGVGRTLDLNKARQLGELAAEYGFLVDALYRHGRRIKTQRIQSLSS